MARLSLQEAAFTTSTCYRSHFMQLHIQTVMTAEYRLLYALVRYHCFTRHFDATVDSVTAEVERQSACRQAQGK